MLKKIISGGQTGYVKHNRYNHDHLNSHTVLYLLLVFLLSMSLLARVDQGALQAAIDSAHSIQHGGWCPPGRQCEIGTIPPQFKLVETSKDCYTETSPPRSMRTFLNVRDSDGTLILIDDTGTSCSRGTAFTIEQAQLLNRPCMTCNDGSRNDVEKVINWIRKNKIQSLNVAGPSEREKPGVYHQAYQFISQLLEIMHLSGFESRVNALSSF